MDARARGLLEEWTRGLGRDRRASLYLLLEELCRGMDVSRHNRFGFLRLRAEFETVLIDAPPASLYSDAVQLGRLSDGVILVLQGNTTRRESALTGRKSRKSTRS